MKRRGVIRLAGGAATLGAQGIAGAQTPRGQLRLGFASANPRDAVFNVGFERRLGELGWVDGHNLAVEYIDTQGRVDLMTEAMRELVRRKVDLMLAPGPEASLIAARQATSSLPIVMVAIDYDPIARGHIAGLARPSEQITGVFFQQIELVGKRLQLMKEVLPELKAATVFWDRLSKEQWMASQNAAPQIGLTLIGVDLGDQPYDYERAFASVPTDHRRALFPMASPILFRDRRRLLQFAHERQVATMCSLREFADAGALITYGANISRLFERAAAYVDRIARGARPIDLPVEQPTQFELVVNLATARTLGVEFSPRMLARADEVIE